MEQQPENYSPPAERLETKALLPMSERFSLVPKSFKEAQEVSQVIAESGMCPKSYEHNGKVAWQRVFVAVQMGLELGLKPMQAIQNIAVINGQPSVWGDAVPAIISSHPSFVDMIETYDEAKQSATCVMKRKGREDVARSFSMADAKAAGLAGKDTYQKYGRRMVQLRARGWAARDMWSDVLKGVGIVEETMHIEHDVTPAKEQTTRTASLAERTAAVARKPDVSDAVVVDGTTPPPAENVDPATGELKTDAEWGKEVSLMVDKINAATKQHDLYEQPIIAGMQAIPEQFRQPARDAYSSKLRELKKAENAT